MYCSLLILINFCTYTEDPEEMDGHEINDECNLLYVAATRAKQYLVLNQTLVWVLAKAKDNFLYLQRKEAVNFFNVA